MRLVKRYFDVIGSAGEYLIGYDAVVQLGPARMRQRALISSADALNCRRLSFEGEASFGDFPSSISEREVEWSTITPPVASPPLAASAGPISWRLDSIGGVVRASKNRSEVSGHGYVETVALDDAPWRLGLETIRWGRFVGARHWAMWNVISGAFAFAFAALDSRSCEIIRICHDCVEVDAGRVMLGPIVHTVHEGDVLASQVPAFAPVIRTLAGNFALDQSKHVRQALLQTCAGEAEEGFAMDETVLVSGRTRASLAKASQAARIEDRS